jgi:adenylosuccinate synthase
MSVDVLLGLQWGDEGKGKVVDYLAPQYDVIARFQGGPNAGHTLEFDGHKHVLHQIPSGIFHANIKNLIGNGVVLDAVVFKKEIAELASFNIDFKKNLFISKKTALIVPTHRLLDAASESAKGDNKIGSTLRGIGPAYQDKIGRRGIRVGDIIEPHFELKYKELVAYHKSILDFYQYDYANLDALEALFFEAINFLKTFNLVDSEYFLNEARLKGEKILAEGAQGSLLDIDFGSYPFVTSSSTMTAGACTGLGVPPSAIGDVYGIFKAYCTRVGSGPFPTELLNDTGALLRKEGNEFGSTTGRPRRCGWIDLPALRYAVMINGVTHLLMMKADVLNVFDEINVCTHYKLEDGSLTDHLPHDLTKTQLEPIWKSFKGWGKALENVRDFDALPSEMQAYVTFLEKELGVPVSMISIGPDRTQTIMKEGALTR